MSASAEAMSVASSRRLEIVFRIGMYWRIIYGFFRLVIGFLLLRFVGVSGAYLFHRVAGHELIEDPHDPLIHVFRPLLEHFSFHVTYFIAAYFIFWGVVDIVLSISLLRHKLWAFPISMLLIVLFLMYEVYRYFHTHSPFLIWIIIVDLAILWIINREYTKLKLKAVA